jgi:spermidine synthase
VPVQVADAREAAARMRKGSADLVVLDTFAGARAPGHLTSIEMVRVVKRLLADGGVVATNLADGPGLRFVRRQLSTYGEAFRHVAAVAEPAVWHGRRFGNVVLLASDARLPIEELTRRCAGDAVPARVLHGQALRRRASGALVVTDATAEPSPAPPLALFGRRTRRR